jgi:hypothetical protein
MATPPSPTVDPGAWPPLVRLLFIAYIRAWLARPRRVFCVFDYDSGEWRIVT